MNRFFLISPFILQTLIWPGTRFLLKFFGHFEVKGLEHLANVSTENGVIFASNHTSELDPILLPAGLPFLSRFMPIFYTSREKKFYDTSGILQLIYGGFIFQLWGAHRVLVGKKDYEKSLANHVKIVEAGKSVFVFPEGGVTHDGSIQPARGGVAYLAERTGAPVIPVGISGAHKIKFSDFFLGRRHIKITFGAAVSVEELRENVARGTDTSVEAQGNIYKEEAEYIMKKVRILI